MDAKERVTEFLRQWKMGIHNCDIINGVWHDPNAAMSELLASDLEAILKRMD